MNRQADRRRRRQRQTKSMHPASTLLNAVPQKPGPLTNLILPQPQSRRQQADPPVSLAFAAFELDLGCHYGCMGKGGNQSKIASKGKTS
jgi:hypothetical protein